MQQSNQRNTQAIPLDGGRVRVQEVDNYAEAFIESDTTCADVGVEVSD